MTVITTNSSFISVGIYDVPFMAVCVECALKSEFVKDTLSSLFALLVILNVSSHRDNDIRRRTMVVALQVFRLRKLTFSFFWVGS